MSKYVSIFDKFIPWEEHEARLAAEKVAAEGLPAQHGARWRCKLCTHPNRVELDTKILSGELGLMAAAREVGPVYHWKSVERHRDVHVLMKVGQMFVPKVNQAELMNPLPFGASLQRKMEWYRMNLLILRQRHLRKNGDGDVESDREDTRIQMALLVQARNTDILAAKFKEGDGAKPVNGIDGAKWERIKTRLSTALEGHPEARLAVLEALEDAE